MDSTDEEATELLLVAIRRADALAAISDGPLRRAELEAVIDVSRTTAHRIIRSLTGHSLVERTSDGLVLTPLGEVVAREVESVCSTFRAARRLEPFLNAFAPTPFDFEVDAFADATVTTPGPGDPYRPVSRFMELLSASDTLRGFDTTSVAPVFVDEIRAEILGGMRTSIVYLPQVVEQIADSHPDQLREAVESGQLELYTSDDLPCGLALFDDRVGLGVYDEETGMLTAFADTDDPDAVRWGERLYEHYLDGATRFAVDADG